MKAYVITIESHSLSNQAANRCIESGKRFGIRIENGKPPYHETCRYLF